MILIPRNVWCLVVFWGRLGSSLQTLTILSVCRRNRNSSVNTMLFQSDAAQLACYLHRFNCAFLDWTDKRTQTEYSGVQAIHMYPVGHSRADIFLPMGATSIDVASWEGRFSIPISTPVMHRSSTWVVTIVRRTTGLWTTIRLVSNCLHNREIAEEWRRRKE